jgi:hypothetical protein
MAGFKTHITVSSLLGVGYGTAAYMMYDVPLPTCVLAGGLCGLSGMLPDLDSGPGVPLRESMAFAAAVVPMMLIHRFQNMGMSHESIILAGAAVYLLIRFGLAELLKRYTVHRGMFHSLPAAAIFGELIYLMSPSDDQQMRLFKAGAVVLGYLSHLVLDEIYSVELRHGLPRLKSSFGSALKLFDRHIWSNVSAFVKLGVLTFLVLYEPNWLARHPRNAAPTEQQAVNKDSQEAVKTVSETASKWWDKVLH